MRLSIIVPTLEEAQALPATLAAIRTAPIHELIVVDGGSRDATRAVATALADRVLSAPAGRAQQMNAGAAVASGDVLLFVHADTLLPPEFDRAIATALEDARVVGGRFDVHLDGASPLLRAVAAAINIRSRLTRIATGDQAIFVRRPVFVALGGYPAIPLLEDVSFTRALKRAGRVACLRDTVGTSARRWEQRGIARTIVLMWGIRLAYALGISAPRLHRFYRDVR